MYPPEYCFHDFDFDVNSMWFLGHPEIGDISAYATGAHAEGYMTQAGRQYSHAEGLSSMTIGKYAQAEGYQTVAVWAAHSEGYQTSAFGQRSHAEGSQTLTRGSSSLACGIKSRALGEGSFAYNGEKSAEYSVSSDGQFGINPAGGEWGFLIGKDSLPDVIRKFTVIPDTAKIDAALSTGESEYDRIEADVISGMHINSNPQNASPIGRPIKADTDSYTGEYCLIRVNEGRTYRIQTRLGDNMCIMMHSAPYVPLSSYEGYLIKDGYAYKEFEVTAPRGCIYLTIDNYTKRADQHMPIVIEALEPKYYRISDLDARITALEE